MMVSINPAPAAANPVKTEKTAASNKSPVRDSAKSEKVKAAIEKFEGLFMSMMIKQLRESDSGEGFFPGDGSDTYGGMFDMFMGDHLAKSADIGIDRLFSSSTAMRQLEEHVNPQKSTGTNAKRHEEYRNEQFRSGITTTPPGS